MPPKTAGTYEVYFFTPKSPDLQELELYASSPASARQIVGKRFGLNEADIVKAEPITDTNE